jgi:hypothetical protein
VNADNRGPAPEHVVQAVMLAVDAWGRVGWITGLPDGPFCRLETDTEAALLRASRHPSVRGLVPTAEADRHARWGTYGGLPPRQGSLTIAMPTPRHRKKAA